MLTTPLRSSPPVGRRSWLLLPVFLGFWLLLMAGGGSRLLRDPGTFWHTVVGDRILAQGFFDTDPFSFTFAGARWVPHQWLGEVAMGLVHRISGLDGLVTVASAILAGLFAWLTIRLVRTGFGLLPAVLITVGAAATGAIHFHVRPHLMTIVGLAVTVAAVADVEAGRTALRRLWWLIPLYLVWSNTHGGVLGGLATLAVVGVGWVGLWRLGRPSPVASAGDVLRLAGIGLACGLTAFVTPYGSGVARAWLEIMRSSRLPRIIEEHAPTDPADPTAWPLLAYAAAYLFLLAGTRPRDWRVTWLLPVFWFAQAMAHVRHAPLFAVTACVLAADVWPHTRWARWLAARRPEYYDPTRPPVRSGWGPVLAAAGAVLAALAIQAAGVRVPVVGAGVARLDSDHWPVELLGALREHEPRAPSGARLFNDLLYGGFVIYYVPGYRVFVDDRCELYGDDWLVDLVRARSGNVPAAMADWEARYGRFDFALTQTGHPFDRYFASRPDEWEVLGRSATATFYGRRDHGAVTTSPVP